MLGEKLDKIRHESTETLSWFLSTGFLLFAALLVRFFSWIMRARRHPKDLHIAGAYPSCCSSWIIMGVSFGTFIVITVRFYKNLLSDEGYLPARFRHQRPASAVQDDGLASILGSSIRIPCCWCPLYYFCHLSVDAFNSNKDLILRGTGVTGNMPGCPGRHRGRLLFFLIIKVITSVLPQIYVSIILASYSPATASREPRFLFCPYHGRIRHILCRRR